MSESVIRVQNLSKRYRLGALRRRHDTLRDQRGRVKVTEADSGAVLLEADFAVDANGIAAAGEVPQADGAALWLIEAAVDGQTLRNHYLCGRPPYDLDQYRRWLPALDIPYPLSEA